ncbi:TolC family protein [Flagellimonas sp. CMM7]|uniref:TolC family protein n=1 Tax=Flagellimonas sp. CMM7 TaxID=2654676 RepID=UPI0013D6E6A6|nr:TolC family protein [Flagellimonas sp. CMM7]UII81689.1 TolC family protein [Flagellimonas sp. CMM7]
MNLRIYLTTLILFISLTGICQKTWTLDECVSYAVEHNLQVKNSSFDKDSGNETYKQSIRNLLPNVTAFTDVTYNTGLGEDPTTGLLVNNDFYSTNFSLNMNIDLFQGFQKLNNIRASKFIYKATQEDVLQQKFLLAFRVMSAFYDIKFNEGLVTNSLEQLEISQSNYDLVNKQVELGIMAKADLYEAESNLLADKLLVTQNKNLLKLAKLTLLQEMNLTEENDIVLQDTLDSQPEKINEGQSVDSVYMVARNFVPLVKAQDFRVKAAKKQLQATRGGLFPSLSLVAGMRTRFSETNTDDNEETIPFKDQFDDNLARFVGAELSVPISLGWANQSRVKQQKIAYLQAKNNLEIQEQQLFQIIQQLVQTNEALIDEYDQSNKRVEAQELAFSIAQKRYEKGLINAIDLFQAKNLYAVTQNENLQVGMRLKISKSTLDFYNGLPIFNLN